MATWGFRRGGRRGSFDTSEALSKAREWRIRVEHSGAGAQCVWPGHKLEMGGRRNEEANKVGLPNKEKREGRRWLRTGLVRRKTEVG